MLDPVFTLAFESMPAVPVNRIGKNPAIRPVRIAVQHRDSG